MKFITKEGLLEERRKATEKTAIAYKLNGATETVEKEIANGEMNAVELTKPMGEMLSSGSLEDTRAFVQKTVLDVETGRETVPLLYTDIYDTITDANFPQTFDADFALEGRCVFLEHVEGGEVKFGSLAAEKGIVARIKGYTTGFEFTKELLMYNQTFKITSLSTAVGEAYNALKNHIALAPIISATYKAANKTAYKAPATGMPAWVGIYEAIKSGIKTAATAGRKGTLILANSADELDIKQALQGGSVNGTDYPKLDGIVKVVLYDGWETKVGQKVHNYPGVPAGKVYLIRPKGGFKEFAKVPLTTEFGGKDLSRLIEDQMVAYSYFGSLAAIDENVQEIAIA